MKFFLFSFFLLHSFLLFAQPGDESKIIRIRVFNSKGELISNETNRYVIKCQSKSQWGGDKFVPLPDSEIKFKNGLEVDVSFGDFLVLTIQDKKTLMTITTQGSIDSIVLTDGNFTFNRYQSYLYSFYPGKDRKITNLNLQDFIEPKFNGPVFTLEESEYNMDGKVSSCHDYAEKIEEKHGGNNWADNSCNDQWQEPFIAEKEWVNYLADSLHNSRVDQTRIMLYPLLKNKLIKHDFFLLDRYWHKISLSEDEGKTWTEVMRVMDEWYVNLVYFTDIEKIGIDVSNSGVMLLSDYDLKDWKYYTHFPYLDDEEPPVGKEIGLVLTTGNWSEGYFGRFYFSE